MLDKMLFILIEFLPVLDVLGQVDFFGGPKGSLLVLVHLPDVVILNGKQHEAVRVLLQERLRKATLGLRVLRVLLRAH
jgi:hypothetical protein